MAIYINCETYIMFAVLSTMHFCSSKILSDKIVGIQLRFDGEAAVDSIKLFLKFCFA